MTSRWMRANQFSTWLSHDEYVGVVHMNATVVGQERLHARRLVAADVVADDVNLAAAGLAGEDVFEEGHELLVCGAQRSCPALRRCWC